MVARLETMSIAAEKDLALGGGVTRESRGRGMIEEQRRLKAKDSQPVKVSRRAAARCVAPPLRIR